MLFQTSYSSAVALYYLAKNQDKQQILFEEITKYLPNKTDQVTSAMLNDMKYLKACIKESMRWAQFNIQPTLLIYLIHVNFLKV